MELWKSLLISYCIVSFESYIVHLLVIRKDQVTAKTHTCSQCLLLIPGFLKPWISGIYGLKFSIFSFTSIATSWQAGISLKCLTHLKIVLKELLTFASSCSASIVVRGSFIQLSYHFCQSDAVSHMFLNGSKSLINRPSLSYCSQYKAMQKSIFYNFHM